MAGKRQRWTVGAVVIVPLGDGIHSYAQMLTDPEFAFFDCRTTDDVPLEEVITRPVLFRLWVSHYAFNTGHWLKIGTALVSSALTKTVQRFKQDPIRPELITLYKDGNDGKRVTVAGCEGLESASVWGPGHVEDRLRSHYAGIPCKWTRSLRPKIIDKAT